MGDGRREHDGKEGNQSLTGLKTNKKTMYGSPIESSYTPRLRITSPGPSP